MCRVLGVSCSGYHTWLRHQDLPPSPREAANQQLSEQIRTVFHRSRGTYGSPCVHAELQARGVECSRNRVARLMKRAGIAAKRRRVFKVSTTDSNHSYPVSPNRLNRQFSAERPDEKWLTDITYIPTREGWLYLATVLDVCSRRVVGWAMDKHMDEGACGAGFADGRYSPPPARRSAAPFGQRQPVCRSRLPKAAQRSQNGGEHEQEGRLLRQRHDGELLLHPQERVAPMESSTRGHKLACPSSST